MKNIIARYLVISLLFAPSTQVFAQETDIPPPSNSEGNFLSTEPQENPVSDPVPETSIAAPEPISPTETINEILETPESPVSEAGSVLGETSPAEESSKAEKDKKDKKEKDKKPPAGEEELTLTAASLGAGDYTGGADGSPSTIKQVIPEVDQTTGALVYSYSIKVPSGRNGIEPSLSLNYNSLSQDPNSALGPGWSISIPYIRRINRTGVNNLYTDTYFESSFTGELVSVSSSSYQSKVDNGEFLKYVKASSTWTVTDKLGRVYKFGNSSSTRQANPASSTQIFQWMLSEVRDLNGNYLTFEYFKDQGQIYPSSTAYTEYGTSTTPFRIEFIREERPSPDISLSYSMGFTATSTYRLKEILALHDNSLVHKYTLGYASSTYGYRKLLDTITESGRTSASSTVILPDTNFDYQGYAAAFATTTPAYTCDGSIQTEQGVIFSDVNADGLVDLMRSNTASSGTYINNGTSGWAYNTIYTPPVVFYSPDNAPYDYGVRAADIDGDGRPDLVRGSTSTRQVYFNTSSGWDTYSGSGWTVPASFVSATTTDTGTRIVDLNADGLPDFIQTADISSSTQTNVWLNDGTNWVSASGWTAPTLLQFGTIFGDVNNDGLIDIIKSFSTSTSDSTWVTQTYINNGAKGWTATSNFAPPRRFELNAEDYGIREADVNGDGYSDLLYAMEGNTRIAYINTGTNWQPSTTNFAPPRDFIDSVGADTGARIVDYDSDGLPDFIDCNHEATGADTTHKNSGVKLDLLMQEKNPFGGTVRIAYKTTPLFRSGSTLLNPKFPLVLDVAETITRDNGFSVISGQTFSYQQGHYYYAAPYDRKMAGFGKVVSTNSASNTITYFYHQGDTSSSTIGEYSDLWSKIGKVYRVEVANSAASIFSKVIKKWQHSTTTVGHLVNVNQAVAMSYDGDADHKDKAESYIYDSGNGNITEETEWGEVTGDDDGTFTDTGSDKRITALTYATSTDLYVYALPATETVTNSGGSKVKENRYYYDNGALNYVDTGNLTKEERWKVSSTYIDIENTYNGLGLITQKKDPRDKATTFAYDTYKLYPATSTNPLSQSTSYTYDYSSGKVLARKDPNGRTFETVLDGLDRVIEEKQPDLTTPTTAVTKTGVAYTDSYTGASFLTTNYNSSGTSALVYTYLDGFGRTLQTRTEAEDTNTYSAVDTVYNTVERVQKDGLPYFSSGSSRTTATTTTALFTQYSYDAMLRNVSSTNAVGTISKSYDQWINTVTDARGKNKSLYNDAYGNLIQVDENNASSTYSTTYEYDLNNNLTKITDALSNVRNFTYDGLSRRLTAQDLHASADITYGIWTYTYDDSGNLTQVDDPKSQTINYTYDDLNRVLTENYTGAGGTEMSYAYDSCTEGVGRLCTASSSIPVITDYTYNVVGGIATETKTVSSTAYLSTYTYDRQGNILTVTNPDSSIIKYTYNPAGLLEQILWKED